MSRIAWTNLMEVGFRGLGLTPAVFWDLTPAEFLLMAGFREPDSLGRAGLEALIARFPDRPDHPDTATGDLE